MKTFPFKKTAILFYISIISIFFSCGRNLCEPCDISVIVPSHIPIEAVQFDKAIKENIAIKEKCVYAIEVVVYKYSSGKEIFLYSANSDKDVTQSVQQGEIEVLVKIKRGSELRESRFLKARGSSKEELIKNIAREIKSDLCD